MKLITDLQEKIQAGIVEIETSFLSENNQLLNWKPNAEKWSVLECIEHLNRYNRYYNHHLEQALQKKSPPSIYKPGWLGDFFVKLVSPENKKPMKTRPHLNPTGSHLDKGTLIEFLDHQQHLLQLLSAAKKNNLNRRSIKVEVMPLMRMKIGDTFRFVITHQQRHLQQACTMFKQASATGYQQSIPADQ